MPYYERKNSRLKKHDYNATCDYFVTICTNNRKFLFGDIVGFNPNIILGNALIPDPRIEIEQSHGIDINILLKQFPDVITKYHPGEMILNNYGKIVDDAWQNLPKHHPVLLAAYQIMPNHVHLTFTIENGIEGAAGSAPTEFGIRPLEDTTHLSNLGVIMRSFKSEVTKRINELSKDKIEVWQRGYYDHIIRDYDDYKRIRTYIVLNPKIWFRDRNNPRNY